MYYGATLYAHMTMNNNNPDSMSPLLQYANRRSQTILHTINFPRNNYFTSKSLARRRFLANEREDASLSMQEWSWSLTFRHGTAAARGNGLKELISCCTSPQPGRRGSQKLARYIRRSIRTKIIIKRSAKRNKRQKRKITTHF